MSDRRLRELPPVIAIAGPTASGKSALALALWQRFEAGVSGWPGAEIVSVDSAQVYRGMDVGTAKPDAAIRTSVPHHLLDILDPAEAYSAARFAEDARAVIAAIRARDHVPILVGGTLLYFRALFEGLSALPAANAQVRAELETEATQRGAIAQHARLAELDPETAARLHPNDAQRVQRALEIHTLTGEPASRLHAASTNGDRVDGRVLRVALLPADRDDLNRRIGLRFERMMQDGFVEEVAGLRARSDLHPALPSMRAVGYRQLWRHLDGDYDRAQAQTLGIIATRQYAKRQLTWLRGDRNWQSFEPTEPLAVAWVLNKVSAPQPS